MCPKVSRRESVYWSRLVQGRIRRSAVVKTAMNSEIIKYWEFIENLSTAYSSRRPFLRGVCSDSMQPNPHSYLFIHEKDVIL
jgi:hypothetical protein